MSAPPEPPHDVKPRPPRGVGERRLGERGHSAPALPAGPSGQSHRRFRMARYFSVSSLASIVVVAVLMTALYREVALGAIIELGERTNLMVARTALLSIEPRLIDYLESVNDLTMEGVKEHPIYPDIEATIRNLMDHTNVVRVLVHTRHGIVAFSTKHDLLGSRELDNPGFRAAVSGELASRLLYRDVFNAFRPAGDEDNLIQTYVPVRNRDGGPVLGVFEVYADVNQSVNEVERAEMVVLIGSVLALGLLYGVLLLVVKRGTTLIEQQQETIHERTRTLELLSARMLTAQESEKQRLANRLSGSVGENLAAIRLLTRRALRSHAGNTSSHTHELLALVDETIRDLQGMAVGLRPPSLDEFGLIETLGALCREYEAVYPSLDLETRFNLDESKVPAALRVIIYRIVQESVDAIGDAGGSHRVRIGLSTSQDSVRLTLAAEHQTPGAGQPASGPLPLASARERTALSGGTFQVAHDRQGGTVARSTWHIA